MLAKETNVQEANKAILHAVVEAYNRGDIEKACSCTPGVHAGRQALWARR